MTHPVPLLPEQHRFLERPLPSLHHWNSSFILRLSAAIRPEHCQRALRLLLEEHEGLRVGLAPVDASAAAMGFVGAEASVRLAVADLTECEDSAVDAEVSEVGSRLHMSLRLDEPPPLRAAFIRLGGSRGNRLLLVVHHFVVDMFSMRVLVNDFVTALRAQLAGHDPRLPVATPATILALRLEQSANNGDLDDHVQLWRQLARPAEDMLANDLAEVNTMASEASVTVAMSKTDSQLLFDTVCRLRGPRDEAVTIACLLEVARQTGMAAIRADLITHGRRGMYRDLRLTRTVGWLASSYPVTISQPRTGEDPVRAAMRQLQMVPTHGVSFGVLRYLRREPSIVAALKELGRPQLLIQHLGNLGPAPNQLRSIPNTTGHGELVSMGSEPTGSSRSGDGLRIYTNAVETFWRGGLFHISWYYSRNLQEEQDVRNQATAFLNMAQAWAQRTG